MTQKNCIAKKKRWLNWLYVVGAGCKPFLMGWRGPPTPILRYSQWCKQSCFSSFICTSVHATPCKPFTSSSVNPFLSFSTGRKDLKCLFCRFTKHFKECFSTNGFFWHSNLWLVRSVWWVESLSYGKHVKVDLWVFGRCAPMFLHSIVSFTGFSPKNICQKV